MADLGLICIGERIRHALTVTIPTRVKKRIVFVSIVLLALWPIVHQWIVAKYDIDPWLFFGLSMYTRARPILGITAFEAAYAGQQLRSVNQDALRVARTLQRNLQELVNGRASYGTLYNPEPVVEEMFDAFPLGVDRLAFTIRLLSLDAEGMLIARDVRTECRKDKERRHIECAVVPVAR